MRVSVALLFAFFLVFSFQLSSQDIASDVLSNMDFSVDPCSDFYSFACGGWIKNFTLPADKASFVRGFGLIEQNNDQILDSIVNDPSNIVVNGLYLSCMNVTDIDSRGISPVQPYLTSVDRIRTWTDFATVVATFHQIQVPALFSIIVDIDPKNPPINIVQVSQGGLALPDRSLYESEKFTQPYADHITKIFTLSGIDPALAPKWAKIVVDFESGLAAFTVPNDNLTDPFALYNPTNTSGLAQMCPNFDWTTYFSVFTSKPFKILNVVTPTYFSPLSDYLLQNSIEVVKIYLKWQLIHAAAPYLSTPFVNETFNFFSKFLGGVQQPAPRSKFCTEVVDSSLGDLVGYLFAQKAFPGASKKYASFMIQEIEDAMTARLHSIRWMDNDTRARALNKISLIANYIGYPDHLRNNSCYIPGTSFYSNILRSAIISTTQMVNKIGKPEDKTLWSMTADTVNAYYDPTRNEMVFPAAILQYPYFKLENPTAMNFGGAGMIMGHELTHGFDNQGRDYDGTGRLTNWWQPQTSKEFDQKVQCVINQYSTFEVLPGVFINGKLTQGENVADMGGIKNAFDAYNSAFPGEGKKRSVVPQFTNNQLLFIAYAQGWCGVATPEYLQNQVKTDPHSWAKFRVLGPLMNFPTFADTFNCPVNSTMNPINRCIVW